jgi:hypothetical protein
LIIAPYITASNPAKVDVKAAGFSTNLLFYDLLKLQIIHSDIFTNHARVPSSADAVVSRSLQNGTVRRTFASCRKPHGPTLKKAGFNNQNLTPDFTAQAYSRIFQPILEADKTTVLIFKHKNTLILLQKTVLQNVTVGHAELPL